MSHLSPSEFVDLVEGTLAPARAAHVDACAACRSRADAARQALSSATSVDVPEPSPLFWDHLSSRVREGIEDARIEPTPWWRRRAAILAWSAAAALILVIAARPAPSRAAVIAPVAAPVTSAAPDARDSDDAAWEMLTALAADVKVEDAHAAGLRVRPATVESAVLELSPAEREELGRLLRDELKHTGA